MLTVRLQAALQLSKDKKQCILENRQRLLLNLEQLLRKQNTVGLYPLALPESPCNVSLLRRLQQSIFCSYIAH